MDIKKILLWCLRTQRLLTATMATLIINVVIVTTLGCADDEKELHRDQGSTYKFKPTD